MGQHLDSLREQAHRVSHEEAKEKRNKRKNKRGGKAEDSVNTEFESIEDDDDSEDGMFGLDHEDNESSTESNESTALPDPVQLKKTMLNVVDRLKESFKSIRGGEPTPELFDSVLVQAYGDTVHLSSVAQVVLVSPTLAHVTCFDPALAKQVRNAIRDTLELNPQLDSDTGNHNNNMDQGLVTVPLPRISMETRQKIVHQLHKQAEATRTRIRNLRRKAMDTVKMGKEGKIEGIGKDDAFRVAKEIDAVVEDVNALIQKVLDDKEASVMAV